MNTALETALNQLRAQFPGYDFEARLKPDTTLLEHKQIVDNILAKLKADFYFNELEFSLRAKTYSAFAVIDIAAKADTDDLAFYDGDDVGFVTFSCILDEALDAVREDKDFRNAGMRAMLFIEDERNASIEIYI